MGEQVPSHRCSLGCLGLTTSGLPTSPPSQLMFKCLLQVPGLFSFSTLLFLSDPSCPVETHCSLASPLDSEESKSRYVPQSLQSQTGQGGERPQGQHALRARRSSQTQGLNFYVKKGWEALADILVPWWCGLSERCKHQY